MVVAMVLGASCNLFLGYGTTPSESGSPSQSAAAPSPEGASSLGTAPSIGPCQLAPEWLVAALQDGLAVRGATLSEVFIGEAWDFTSGPAAVMSAQFVPAWWIVAKINGASVRPEVVIWVTSRTGASKQGQTFGANLSAVRYSKFGQGGSDPVRGSGQAALLGCLTPIPES